MMSVGETLRQARVAQGLTLEQVAARTKIQLRYLSAIEQDQPEQLPGSFFYKSFVHQYAGLLGLDTSDMDDALQAKSATPATDSLQPLTRPISVPPVAANTRPDSPRWMWSVSFLLLVMLACSGLYVWYNHTVRADGHPGAANDRGASSPSGSGADDRGASSAKLSPVLQNSLPQPGNDANSANPAGTPNAPDTIALTLSATEDTWVSVTADGKRVFTGILKPNETREIQSHETAKITVGNAGGLNVQFNGKPVGSLGARGQVRIIEFTPGKFDFVEQAPKPAGEADLAAAKDRA